MKQWSEAIPGDPNYRYHYIEVGGVVLGKFPFSPYMGTLAPRIGIEIGGHSVMRTYATIFERLPNGNRKPLFRDAGEDLEAAVELAFGWWRRNREAVAKIMDEQDATHNAE